MKKLSLAMVFLIVASIIYCSLPLTSVVTITLTIVDQNNRKILSGGTARFLDQSGLEIVKITSKTKGSWGNVLHWWSHSLHDTSNLRPRDAMRAVSVRIDAENCEAVRLPVMLERNYEPLSFAPHGGGRAYYIYRFKRKVILNCD